MHNEDANVSRATTPESPLTNSLHHATTTIDDLTTALTNFSRVPSPEPPSALTCCCGKEDCENVVSWLAMKSRLESRLILSAGMSLVVLVGAYLRSLLEVGQALLQRHEGYVRQLEASVPWISLAPTNWSTLAEESWTDEIYFQPERCQ